MAMLRLKRALTKGQPTPLGRRISSLGFPRTVTQIMHRSRGSAPAQNRAVPADWGRVRLDGQCRKAGMDARPPFLCTPNVHFGSWVLRGIRHRTAVAPSNIASPASRTGGSGVTCGLGASGCHSRGLMDKLSLGSDVGDRRKSNGWKAS